jgi:hypothetical protein
VGRSRRERTWALAVRRASTVKPRPSAFERDLWAPPSLYVRVELFGESLCRRIGNSVKAFANRAEASRRRESYTRTERRAKICKSDQNLNSIRQCKEQASLG